MSCRKVLLVVNPFSGRGSKDAIVSRLTELLSEKCYEVEIQQTTRPGEARKLAAYAAGSLFRAVVVVGGDGTVNEVASALIETDTTLGIIPCGSGNGLARHMGIPMDLPKAMQVVVDGHIEQIDYATANGNLFFVTMGSGFDAEVSRKFANGSGRGAFKYVRDALSLYPRYNCKPYTITYSLQDQEGGNSHQQIIEERAFLVTCCNAGQWGNGAWIAPNASITDGVLDIVIVKPFKAFEVPRLVARLMRRTIDKDRRLTTIRTPKAIITRQSAGIAHIDGEPMELPSRIEVECHAKGLKVITASTTEKL